MSVLAIREFHQRLNARFTAVNRTEVVEHYGDPPAEHAALRETAGVLDLSFRSRLCLTGADRQKFLNGQVTNNVKDLKTGEGCYAALVNAKGRMQSDLNIYILEDEILLDFEPGYGATVVQRLEKYIIADDVQVVDVAAHYGLISVQGPEASEVIRALDFERPAGRPAADPSRESRSGCARVVGSAGASAGTGWVELRDPHAELVVDPLGFGAAEPHRMPEVLLIEGVAGIGRRPRHAPVGDEQAADDAHAAIGDRPARGVLVLDGHAVAVRGLDVDAEAGPTIQALDRNPDDLSHRARLRDRRSRRWSTASDLRLQRS